MPARRKKEPDALTDQQAAFVDAYFLNNFNATRAAEIAGYADPNRNGGRIKASPLVAAAIRQRIAERAMDADEVLHRLGEQARVSIEDFYDFGEDSPTGTPYLNLEKAKRRGVLHLVKGIEFSNTGRLVLKLHDAQTALLNLGRYHKLFTDRQEVTTDVLIREYPEGV